MFTVCSGKGNPQLRPVDSYVIVAGHLVRERKLEVFFKGTRDHVLKHYNILFFPYFLFISLIFLLTFMQT